MAGICCASFCQWAVGSKPAELRTSNVELRTSNPFKSRNLQKQKLRKQKAEIYLTAKERKERKTGFNHGWDRINTDTFHRRKQRKRRHNLNLSSKIRQNSRNSCHHTSTKPSPSFSSFPSVSLIRVYSRPSVAQLELAPLPGRETTLPDRPLLLRPGADRRA